MYARTIKQMIFWNLLWMTVYQMNRGPDLSWTFFQRSFIMIPTTCFVILFNTGFLLPKLYFPKRYFWYILAAVVLLASINRLLLAFHPFLEAEALMRPGLIRGGSILAPITLSLIGSTLYEVSIFAKDKEQEALDLRSEKLEAEMKFLKSQINPHFLFNALNNIYTQTLLKRDDAAENLLKLSAMLRYVLYDCSVAFVPLRKELEYIRNFIDLFRLKDSAGIDVRLSLDESRPERQVAPLLFVPLIENAFKHSDVETIGKGWVEIMLKNEAQQIVFTVKNSLSANPLSKDKTGGIGLDNVRRQLELVYPGRHRLQIEAGADYFFVQLTLQENI
jgi:two-component system, LytTR family, sensor kinase